MRQIHLQNASYHPSARQTVLYLTSIPQTHLLPPQSPRNSRSKGWNEQKSRTSVLFETVLTNELNLQGYAEKGRSLWISSQKWKSLSPTSTTSQTSQVSPCSAVTEPSQARCHNQLKISWHLLYSGVSCSLVTIFLGSSPR